MYAIFFGLLKILTLFFEFFGILVLFYGFLEILAISFESLGGPRIFLALPDEGFAVRAWLLEP